MTTTTSIREGQFLLNDFYMTTPTQNLSLREICGRADIYESILEPAVIAEFVFADAKGVFNAFDPLEQKIVIDFNTSSDNPDANVRYEFFPISVNPVRSTPDDKAVVYKITCITEEAKKSQIIRNVPLVRNNIESENMILAYLQLLGSTKQFYFEPTQGLQAYNMTGMTPFQCIDKIRLEALSSKYQGHAYCFFENSKGYVFKTIEGLIDEGKKKIGDKYFVQVALANLDVTASTWRNILAFKVIQRGNLGITRMIGGGGNVIQQYNIKTGEVTIFDNDPSQFEFVSLNEGSTDGSLVAREEFNDEQGRIEIVPFNPDLENAELARKRNVLPFYMSHFLNVVCQITVYGDSSITAGDVITCEIPEHDGLPIGEEKPYIDSSQIVAGNYLITKCRHVLTFNERAEYLQAYEIVKDGVGGNRPRAT